MARKLDTAPLGRSPILVVRVPAALIEQLDRKAQARGVPRSEVAREALTRGLGRRR